MVWKFLQRWWGKKMEKVRSGKDSCRPVALVVEWECKVYSAHNIQVQLVVLETLQGAINACSHV